MNTLKSSIAVAVSGVLLGCQSLGGGPVDLPAGTSAEISVLGHSQEAIVVRLTLTNQGKQPLCHGVQGGPALFTEDGAQVLLTPEAFYEITRGKAETRYQARRLAPGERFETVKTLDLTMLDIPTTEGGERPALFIGWNFAIYRCSWAEGGIVDLPAGRAGTHPGTYLGVVSPPPVAVPSGD